MILYKAIKNGVGCFIGASNVKEYHSNGYQIVKVIDQTDIATIEAVEKIPDGFIEFEEAE